MEIKGLQIFHFKDGIFKITNPIGITATFMKSLFDEVYYKYFASQCIIYQEEGNLELNHVIFNLSQSLINDLIIFNQKLTVILKSVET